MFERRCSLKRTKYLQHVRSFAAVMILLALARRYFTVSDDDGRVPRSEYTDDYLRSRLYALRSPRNVCGGFEAHISSLKTGMVQPHLSSQCLGHLEFHHGLRTALIQLMLNSSAITNTQALAVIVGVEFGYEIEAMLQIGLDVVGYEPNPGYFDHLDQIVEQNPGRVVIHKFGAGKENIDAVKLSYQSKEFTAEIVTLDSTISRSILSLSIDVQMNEFNVLIGARRILSERAVAIIFVEYQPGKGCIDILNLLDGHGYVLFDFIWYGNEIKSSDPMAGSYYPEAFSDYASLPRHAIPTEALEVEKHCTAVQEPGDQFRWLQNDIVAIHRSYVTNDLLQSLSKIRSRCGESFPCERSSRLEQMHRHPV